MMEGQGVQEGFRTGRRSSYAFGLLFTLAAALTATTVWQAASGNLGVLVYTLLAINGLVILGLISLAAWRVLRLLRSREEGAKLHLRFMALFALAAVAPAVVVAFFFGILVNQGIDNWFSASIRSVVDSHAAVANSLLQSQSDQQTMVSKEIATDLNDAVKRRVSTDDFGRLLQEKVRDSNLRSLHIINRKGEVLASVEPPGAPPYIAPTPDDFAQANQKDTAATTWSRKEDVARIVFRLPAADDLYVAIASPMPKGLLSRLVQSESAVTAYRKADANRSTVQAVFMLSYVETALIVLIGAIWLGMAAASAISEPVAKLVRAANAVARGELSVRVETGSQIDEIETLSDSFNRMTDDLRRQQAALRAAGVETENRRQFIEAVLSGVSAGVLGVDPQMRVTVINHQALLLLGIEEEESLGAFLDKVAPEFAAVAKEAAETGVDAEEEIDLMRGAEVRRLRVRAGGAARGGLVLTFDDITRLVAAQRNAAWKDVARRIAHEIKNPLTPIQLSAERLRRKYRKEIASDLETFDRCTDTIVRQVGDIGRMVDEFSAFARMPAPKFTACDGSELLRQAVFARRVANPDIDIALEDDGLPDAVVCDDRMIGQALANVLKNAAEAVEARAHAEPGHKGHITARLKHDGENVVYEIEDNGIGLPAKDRARLTEPYVTTREKGTGLGLAIVKRILEDHGGSLTLRDAQGGHGALVVMSFPRGEGAIVPAAVAAEA